MADPTTIKAAPAAATTYVPGKTLGRSGYAFGAEDQMAKRIAHLDALLCVLVGEADDEGLTDFRRLNNQIQQTALELAADLAEEVHELYTQLSLEPVAGKSGAVLKEVAHG